MAMFCGLGGLVQLTREDPKCTDYHLHGFARLTPRLTKVAATTAIASQVADGILSELLADDRVARRADELHSSMKTSLDRIRDMAPGLWGRLAHFGWPRVLRGRHAGDRCADVARAGRLHLPQVSPCRHAAPMEFVLWQHLQELAEPWSDGRQ